MAFTSCARRHVGGLVWSEIAARQRCGARKGELLGLQWHDLEGNKLRIERQLLRTVRSAPTFIPPKRGGIRTIDLSDETMALLAKHKREQAILKMRNRTVYTDNQLIFGKQWKHKGETAMQLGSPLHMMMVNRALSALCEAAKVRSIKPHGLRHTKRRCCSPQESRLTSCSAGSATGTSRSRSTSTHTSYRRCSKTRHRARRYCRTAAGARKLPWLAQRSRAIGTA